MRTIFLLLALALTGAFAATALGAESPNQAYAERTLKAAMTKTYKTEAPGLVITKVKCPTPPASGETSFVCTAYFTVASEAVDGSYKVSMTLKSGGKATWTAESPVCKNAKTGKKISC